MRLSCLSRGGASTRKNMAAATTIKTSTAKKSMAQMSTTSSISAAAFSSRPATSSPRAALSRATTSHCATTVSKASKTSKLATIGRSSVVARATEAEAATTTSTSATSPSPSSAPASAPGPALTSLELLPVIDQQGYIAPCVPSDSDGACVLAVYSENRTLQLVAFSANPRKSLVTLVGRRPDRAFFYRAAFFPKVDQEAMIGLREAWFKENAGAPSGNKLALERDAWTQPVSAGAISQRGKRAAAEGAAADLLQKLRNRGCVEDLVPDEELLDAGKVDFVAAGDVSEEERAAALRASQDRAARARVVRLPKGVVPPTAECTISRAFATNGGVMFDLTLAHNSVESEHRVIVGKTYYEPFNKTPEEALDAVLAFLLWTQTERHTDGMLLSSQFNSNYFAVGELESMWGEAFEEHLELAGLREKDPEGQRKREGIYSPEVWRFARTQDYKDEGVAEPMRDALWV